VLLGDTANRGLGLARAGRGRPVPGEAVGRGLAIEDDGVPPPLSTAAATAAPRPDEPPVTMTVPRESAGME
jgi:hypothetical protein